MLRLELDHGFKFVDGVLQMPQTFLGQAELKIQRGHGEINFLGLLKRLDGRLRLILPQISAAHEVIRGGAVVIEAEGLPALLNNFGIIVARR